MRRQLLWIGIIVSVLSWTAPAWSLCQGALPGGVSLDCTIPSTSTGWGTAPVTVSSAAITTGMTLGPTVAAFPMPGARLPSMGFVAYNQVGSAGPFYICPLGGSCSPTNGIEVGIGASKPIGTGNSTTVPTAISPLGAVMEIRW